MKSNKEKLKKYGITIIILVSLIMIGLIFYNKIYEYPKYKARRIERIINELDKNIVKKVGD